MQVQMRMRTRTQAQAQKRKRKRKRRAKVVQAFPSTGSVMRLLGGVIDEVNAEWASQQLFMSKESLAPVLGLERAESRVGEIEPDEEVRVSARVIMKVALVGSAKAA